MSNKPPDVLGYASAPSGTRDLDARIEYRVDSSGLTVTIPAPPLWRLMVWPALKVFVGFGVASLFSLGIQEGFHEDSVVVISAFSAVLLVAGVFLVWQFRGLLRTIRQADRPSVVRVSNGTLKVDSRIESRIERSTWPCVRIIDLIADTNGLAPGWAPLVCLRITFSDESLVLVRLPWTWNEPAQKLEKHLRAAIGLTVGTGDNH